MTANDYNGYFPTWCPGCGDFGIWASLKNALLKLNLTPDKLAIVFGIGCSGNMNDFVKAYGFHSLHGRSIPTAKGIRMANHKLPVIVVGGDGDLYGEGGNHFLHACRGNFDLTVIIHNNQVYGLTTGQVSPTAFAGRKSKSTPAGIVEVPINPAALAITQGATFVAQGFAGDIPQLTDLIIAGVNHQGFSVINTFQPCVSFNKINTYDWYREYITKLSEGYDKTNIHEALKKVLDTEKLSTGVLFEAQRPTYEASLTQIAEKSLVEQNDEVDLTAMLSQFT